MVQQVKVLSRDPHGGRRETTGKKGVLWLTHTYSGMYSLYLQINEEMQFKKCIYQYSLLEQPVTSRPISGSFVMETHR